MGRNKIKFNSRGFRRILVGPGVSGVVGSEAHRMAARAGKGVTAKTMVGGFGGGRTVGIVTTMARTQKEAEQQRERLESAAHGG